MGASLRRSARGLPPRAARAACVCPPSVGKRRMPVGTFRRGALSGALSIALAATSFSPRAIAQTAESQAAEALFRQAKSLMDQGHLEPAREKFAASQALEPGLGTLLYLGDCYERAGRFASALATFREGAKLAEERDDPTRLRLAQVRVSALEP